MSKKWYVITKLDLIYLMFLKRKGLNNSKTVLDSKLPLQGLCKKTQEFFKTLPKELIFSISLDRLLLAPEFKKVINIKNIEDNIKVEDISAPIMIGYGLLNKQRRILLVYICYINNNYNPKLKIVSCFYVKHIINNNVNHKSTHISISSNSKYFGGSLSTYFTSEIWMDETNTTKIKDRFFSFLTRLMNGDNCGCFEVKYDVYFAKHMCEPQYVEKFSEGLGIYLTNSNHFKLVNSEMSKWNEELSDDEFSSSSSSSVCSVLSDLFNDIKERPIKYDSSSDSESSTDYEI